MQSAHKIFKVYCLINPVDNDIRYIGITSRPVDKRLLEHLQKAKCKQTYKDFWINSLLSKNIKPIIEVIDEIEDYKFWEPHYISLYKSWGFKLTNATNGGENGEISLESKRKISLKLKGNMHGFKKGNIPFTKGKKFKDNPEIYSSCPGTKKGVKFSDEHKSNIGNSRKGKGQISIMQYDLNGNFIKEWESATVAEKDLSISIGKINMVCRKKRNKAGGYIWSYK